MCGLIGHEDRACNIIFKTGEKAQFRPWLRAFMDRKRNSGDDRGRWAGGRASSNGPRGSTWHSTPLSGSGEPSWRKDKGIAGSGGTEKEKGTVASVTPKHPTIQQKEHRSDAENVRELGSSIGEKEY